MTFKSAVESIPELRPAYCPGLRALRGDDSTRVAVRRTSRLTGSVDLDTTLKPSAQNESRWDYGIGYKGNGNEEAIWIEVHPADSHHVRDVIAKSQWLRRWLATAPDLLRITRNNRQYVWLSTKGVSLQPGSRQARQLAMAGVSFPQKRLILS